MKLNIDGKAYYVQLNQDTVSVDGNSFKVQVRREDSQFTIQVNGRPYKIELQGRTVLVNGKAYRVETLGAGVRTPTPLAPKTVPRVPDFGVVKALMPGRVISIRVREGAEVKEDAVLMIIEAMKMENEIRAPQGGMVKRIAVAEGTTVNNSDVLIVLE
ncbi:MAG: acetyl-CoA carboxylase biotin carboxyl carrier protein subunit [Chloroflexi bacterium]|nr:acetyl-CoA carboxylase biotin carboxyl carrier protein subunit [Chloroflexota bacterium]MCL5074784.1 acetyl-CoA carboxylase biotin carboxyl carrier protein subunit [Chloroflexota bacterium]